MCLQLQATQKGSGPARCVPEGGGGCLAVQVLRRMPAMVKGGASMRRGGASGPVVWVSAPRLPHCLVGAPFGAVWELQLVFCFVSLCYVLPRQREGVVWWVWVCTATCVLPQVARDQSCAPGLGAIGTLAILWLCALLAMAQPVCACRML
jgi:hypothetical protein